MTEFTDLQGFIEVSSSSENPDLLFTKCLDPRLSRESRMLFVSMLQRSTVKTKTLVELLFDYLKRVVDGEEGLEAVDTSVLIDVVVRECGHGSKQKPMDVVWKLFDFTGIFVKQGEDFKNAEMCLRVLEGVLRRHGELLDDQVAELQRNTWKMIDKMFIDIVQVCELKNHQSVIVSILGPLSTLPSTLPTLASRLWKERIVPADEDCDGTLLLCLLVGSEAESEKRKMIRNLLAQEDFWTILQRYFICRDSLCRKRAVHILRNILDFVRDVTKEVPKNGLGAERHWLEDYLDVFSHLEGANSTHLYEQVGVYLKYLFQLVASQPTDRSRAIYPRREGEWLVDVVLSEAGVLPLPSFGWLKAIIRMLLDLSLPTIRKLSLHSILCGSVWPLNVLDIQVLHWVAEELPRALDSSSYFPSPLSTLSGSRGTEEEGEKESKEPSMRFQQQYPGILLPSMISRIMTSSSSDNRRFFLRGLVRTLCINAAFKGVLVATWAFSAFSDASLQAFIPHDTFKEPELRLISSYVGVQLAAANTTLRARLYEGFVPLLVRGSSVSNLGSVGPEPLLAILDQIGLQTILSNPSSLSLLSETLRRCELREMPWAQLSARTALLVHAAMEQEPARMAAVKEALLSADLKTLQTSSPENLATDEGRGAREIAVAAAELLCTSVTTISPVLVERDILPSSTFLAAGLARAITGAIEGIDSCRQGSLHSLRELERIATTLGRMRLFWASSHGDELLGIEAYNSIVTSTILSILDYIRPRKDCIVSMVSLRTLTCLMQGLSEANADSALAPTAARDCLGLLLSSKSPSAEDYVTSLTKLQRLGGSSDLVDSVVKALGTHGKIMNAFFRDRWMSLFRLLRVCDPTSSVLNVGATVLPLLEDLREEVATLFVDAIPPFLGAMCSLMQVVVATDGDSSIALFQGILEAAWTSAIEAATALDGQCAIAFIDCLYSPSLAPLFDTSFVRHHHSRLIALGQNDRPSLMNLVALRLCVLIRRHPSLLGTYRQEILALIFTKEPGGSARNSSNAFHAIEASLQSTATRFTVLATLEDLLSEGEEGGSMDAIRDLLQDLLTMNKDLDFVAPAMVGSDAYVRKLRCWQSLCVLSPAIDKTILEGVLTRYFATIRDKCLGEIRTHMEIFGALLTRHYPDRLLPPCLELLHDSNLPQHVQCTAFIVLGFVLFHLPQEADTTKILSKEMVLRVTNVILPWIGVSSGLSRAIALLLLLDLIPRVCNVDCTTPEHAHLRGIYKMITNNKETQKVLSRQQSFFRAYPLDGKDTLRGLLEMPRDPSGEIVPDNLVNVVLRVFRSSVLEVQQEDRLCLTPGDASSRALPGAFAEAEAITRLQTKVVPFDELKLALQSDAYSRSLNGALRKRQRLVVCASLVDKVQNLAGIARTCEIFSVESMVMHDMNVKKSDVFKGIAVSSDNWLPMQEVKRENLLIWLRSMKAKGYDILGLEQTDNSVTLGGPAPVELPQMAVLLVGKEKEGIPVDYLQEISLCLEIPQYGVIRSLNVHVSTAIAIWEMTKSNFKES